MSGETFAQTPLTPSEPLIYNLLSKRDLVTFAARRRHGKTTLLSNLALALAAPDAAGGEFLGFKIVRPARTLVLLLEDDPAGYQERFKKMIRARDLQGRMHLLFRATFQDAGIPIDVKELSFRTAVEEQIRATGADLLIVDNLSHLINAEYNDPTRMNQVTSWYLDLAKRLDVAVITAAHPRKETDEPISLAGNDERFFEAVMGSSHLVNVTGSLWGLERHMKEGYGLVRLGRQRAEGGASEFFRVRVNDDEWFERDRRNVKANLSAVLTSGDEQARRAVWKLLSSPFKLQDAKHQAVPGLMTKPTFYRFIAALKAAGAILETNSGEFVKAKEVEGAAT